jgi:hypothetical protein
MEAEDVANHTIKEMKEGKFLITPHMNVLDLVRTKGEDRDKWVK